MEITFPDSLFLFIEELRLNVETLPWGRLYETAKFTFIFLDILLIIGFILVFPKAWKYRPPFNYDYKPDKRRQALKAAKAEEKWATLLAKAETAPPQSLTLAIIEADMLVDSLLKDLGLRGEHMADRLEQLAQEEIPSLEKLWQAHKTRNNIVHTAGYQLSEPEARATLGFYEAFLRDIGAL